MQEKFNSDLIWALSSINGLLILVASFFIKIWMKSVKDETDGLKEVLKEHKDEIKQIELKNQEEISRINHEIGKRKGEIDLLKKDVEKLASDSLNNFENLKLHLNYQKTSLEEIKKDAKERKLDMDSNFKTLIELISKR